MTNPDPREVLNITAGVIALILCALLGSALLALFKFDVRPVNHDILLMVITFLTAKLSTIVDFYYSSSAGSRKQQDIIASQASTIQAAQVALPPVAGAPDASVTLKPGETATVAATPEQPN